MRIETSTLLHKLLNLFLNFSSVSRTDNISSFRCVWEGGRGGTSIVPLQQIQNVQRRGTVPVPPPTTKDM